jgi:TonB family protein
MKHLTLVILLAVAAPLSWGEKPSLEEAINNAKGNVIVSNQSADTDCVWSGNGIWLMRKNLPKYPRMAKWRKITGSVTLEYDVSRLGKVRNIRVLESRPAKTFDKAAIEAVSQYVYKPIVRDGTFYAVKNVVCQLDFTL